MKHAQNLIDGEWVGTVSVERRNPADNDEVVSLRSESTSVDVDEAVSAAAEAQAGWATQGSVKRGSVLLDAADLLWQRQVEIAEDLTREEGKTLVESMGEVRRAIDVLRFFGALGWHASGESLPSVVPNTAVTTRVEPLGVVGIITPWNFPIAIPAWKMAPALVSGNGVVLKPADLTPLSANHLTRALLDAGLPAGVLNVVHGGGTAGDVLVRHRNVAAISFTGSTAVGRGIFDLVNARRARVQLEMGGKNAYLVLDDADSESAASVVAAGAFGLTGQACTATSRVYVTPGIRDSFVAALRARAMAVRPGNGLDKESSMGPVVSAAQLEKDCSAIRAAREAGYASGGDIAPARQQFLDPVVFSDVPHDSPLARDEVFGPVVAVIDTKDYEEGLAWVNDSSYGLTAGICTNDLAKAHDFAARVQVGVVKVNRPTTGLDLNVPFGGVRDSSTNTFREQGVRAIDFYTWSKSVYMGHDAS